MSTPLRGTEVGLPFITPAFAHNFEPDVTLFNNVEVFDGKTAASIENANAVLAANTTFLLRSNPQET